MALQLPKDDCCRMGYRTLEDLENVAEAQVDEQIIPAITDLDVPLVMDRRLKLVKTIREAAKVSWDRKLKGTVEDKNGLLPSQVLKRLELSFQQAQTALLRRCRRRRNIG